MRLLDQYQGCPFNKVGGGLSVSHNKHFGGQLIGNVENFVFTNIFKNTPVLLTKLHSGFRKEWGYFHTDINGKYFGGKLVRNVEKFSFLKIF